MGYIQQYVLYRYDNPIPQPNSLDIHRDSLNRTNRLIASDLKLPSCNSPHAPACMHQIYMA